MTRTDLEEMAAQRELELLFADGFDEAIIGLANQRGAHQVVYSTQKCIEILAREMSYDEAVEFFFFNVEGAWLGDSTCIFIETETDF